MKPVNILEARSNLSRLIAAVESGREAEVVLARNGRPVARIVPLASAPVEHRIGVARGLIQVPDDIDASNAEVSKGFSGAP